MAWTGPPRYHFGRGNGRGAGVWVHGHGGTNIPFGPVPREIRGGKKKWEGRRCRGWWGLGFFAFCQLLRTTTHAHTHTSHTTLQRMTNPSQGPTISTRQTQKDGQHRLNPSSKETGLPPSFQILLSDRSRSQTHPSIPTIFSLRLHLDNYNSY